MLPPTLLAATGGAPFKAASHSLAGSSLPRRSAYRLDTARVQRRQHFERERPDFLQALKRSPFRGHGNYDEVCSRPGLAIPQPVRYTTRDWYRVLCAWPASQVLRRIWPLVLSLTAWAVLITVMYEAWHFQPLTLTAHGLVGTALGLLLVFRTNSANDRFWEGRKMWEQVVSASREVASMCCCYAKYMGITRVRKVCRLLCAFSVSLTEYLVGPKRREDLVHKFQYSPEEEALISSSSSPPYRIAQMILFEFASVPNSKDGMFTNRERTVMLGMVSKLTHAIAQGERLVQTPIPQSYVRHTSRFLTLWLATLPFGLAQAAGWWTPAIVMAASWALIGIQDLGQGIEHPFDGPQSLPLKVMCDNVRDSVADALQSIAQSNTRGLESVREMVERDIQGQKQEPLAYLHAERRAQWTTDRAQHLALAQGIARPR
mmetsp:Transcript_56813/g.133431  ORF Transcript_56813/g.133431 Transcript_56813/m.133431 type:complete len:431 (-) Transcript_56813:157-1449(-)